MLILAYIPLIYLHLIRNKFHFPYNVETADGDGKTILRLPSGGSWADISVRLVRWYVVALERALNTLEEQLCWLGYGECWFRSSPAAR